MTENSKYLSVEINIFALKHLDFVIICLFSFQIINVHVSYSSEVGSGHDEDAESGNGPSLPHSPHSVDGAIGGSKSLDSDFEEPKHSVFERR